MGSRRVIGTATLAAPRRAMTCRTSMRRLTSPASIARREAGPLACCRRTPRWIGGRPPEAVRVPHNDPVRGMPGPRMASSQHRPGVSLTARQLAKPARARVLGALTPNRHTSRACLASARLPRRALAPVLLALPLPLPPLVPVLAPARALRARPASPHQHRKRRAARTASPGRGTAHVRCGKQCSQPSHSARSALRRPAPQRCSESPPTITRRSSLIQRRRRTRPVFQAAAG